jgi:hypothetical protein
VPGWGWFLSGLGVGVIAGAAGIYALWVWALKDNAGDTYE